VGVAAISHSRGTTYRCRTARRIPRIYPRHFTPHTGVVMIALEIPLRWGDMDAYGHINNVQIVRLMEEARVLAFGIPSGTGTLDATTPKPHVNLLAGVGDSVMTLIAEHTVKYRRQLPYRGVPVRVEVGVDKVKGASVEVSYAFYDGDDIAVSATSTMVFVGQESGRPVRLSEQQRAEIAKLR